MKKQLGWLVEETDWESGKVLYSEFFDSYDEANEACEDRRLKLVDTDSEDNTVMLSANYVNETTE
jgi:hypothetical protein